MNHNAGHLERAQRNIRLNFPQLAVDSISFAGEGMENRAFLVNGEWIFRFPKHEDAAGQLTVESRLLPQLRRAVRLRIPDFEYAGRQVEDGLPFAGYRMIAGEELLQDRLMALDPGLQDRLIAAMAGFLLDVHAFPVSTARQCGVRTDGFKADYTSDWEEARREAYAFLDRSLVDYVESLYGGYLLDAKNFAAPPVLLHADFSPDHILYDSESGAIAGIIDFGDIQIGDPDYDLHYLYEDYWGEDFIRRLLSDYPHDDPDRLLRKLDFFSRCDAVRETVKAVRSGDEGRLQAALARLKDEADG
jgi:aminoglycoside 2''-phosphotransferase